MQVKEKQSQRKGVKKMWRHAKNVMFPLPNFSREKYVSTCLAFLFEYNFVQHQCNYCGAVYCGSCTVKVKKSLLGATCESYFYQWIYTHTALFYSTHGLFRNGTSVLRLQQSVGTDAARIQ